MKEEIREKGEDFLGVVVGGAEDFVVGGGIVEVAGGESGYRFGGRDVIVVNCGACVVVGDEEFDAVEFDDDSP